MWQNHLETEGVVVPVRERKKKFEECSVDSKASVTLPVKAKGLGIVPSTNNNNNGLDQIKSRAWASASLNLNSTTSRYATIPRRRRGLNRAPGLTPEYYESFFCEGNASVSSLPATTKPTLSYLIDGKEVKSSSISHFSSLPPSRLPSVIDDDFSFLNEYDSQDLYDYEYYELRGVPCESVSVDQYYFLPKITKDAALEEWEKLMASGKFDMIVDKESFAKPKCLKAMTMTGPGMKAKGGAGTDLSMWL